ncbi:hypothetical protein LC608_29260 [Nostoc sp. XA010]|nr:hypothetical protein [Nostoc sp. XA010]MCC5660989.1 hypothetical protein [Nostoc sp. XA010]
MYLIAAGSAVLLLKRSKVEQGMRPLQASVEAMDELTGAVVSTSLY